MLPSPHRGNLHPSPAPPALPQVVRRGAPPLGGGQVIVRLPVVKHLPPISLTDEGMVKRIRGVAYSARVSPQASNRMVDGARTILNEVHREGARGRRVVAWCMVLAYF